MSARRLARSRSTGSVRLASLETLDDRIAPAFLVSSTSTGNPADFSSFNPAISQNGRFVVFASIAKNLEGANTFDNQHIYRKDTESGQLIRSDLQTDGTEGFFDRAGSNTPSISHDGRYVAFSSQKVNALQSEVYLKDTQTGTLTILSTESFPSAPFQRLNRRPFFSAFSSNNKYVVFESDAGGIVAGDTNGRIDVFLRELATGITTRILATGDGSQAKLADGSFADTLLAGISNEGNSILVSTISRADSDTLAIGQNTSPQPIVQVDRRTGAITPIVTLAPGTNPRFHRPGVSVNPLGTGIAFDSLPSNVIPGDPTPYSGIFFRDSATGHTILVSTAADGTPANAASTNPSFSQPTSLFDPSANNSANGDFGQFVTFTSTATNLVPGDTNGVADVFVKNLKTGVIRIASTTADGSPVDQASVNPLISSDGRFIAFTTYATNASTTTVPSGMHIVKAANPFLSFSPVSPPPTTVPPTSNPVPAGLTRTFSTSTSIQDVVTNTPRTIELAATKIYVGGTLKHSLAEAYNPADPDIAAAINQTRDEVQAANPGKTIYTVTHARIGVTAGSNGGNRVYPMTYRTLTSNDPTQVETGRMDTVLETVEIHTVGPATIRVGPNGADTLFVPAGTVNTNTVMRIRRDIATTTSQTYTTTQFVLVGTVAPTGGAIGGGVTTFSTSTRNVPRFNLVSTTNTQETAATRIVGSFNGVRYDVTLNVPYNPADPAVQAAIAAATSSVRSAGAGSTRPTLIGMPQRSLVSSSTATSEATVIVEERNDLPFIRADGVFRIDPIQPGETPNVAGINGFIGPAIILVGDNLATPFFVAAGDTNNDIFSTFVSTTTRTRITTDSYQTLTTIEVVGEADANVIYSNTTYIDEVITNTPRVIERDETRIAVPNQNSGFAYDQTIRSVYDTFNPQILASVNAARAVAVPGNPSAAIVQSSGQVQITGLTGIYRTNPQKYRRLTSNDTNQIETARSDSVLETVTVVTVGPATVRTGLNGSETIVLSEGQRHVNTITRIRRDIATETRQTYTTTQIILVTAPRTGPGSGGTTFTTSTRTIPQLNLVNATANVETAATRIIGRYLGVPYDVTLNVAYDPNSMAIQNAIAAARQAILNAGANTTRVATGQAQRTRLSSDMSVSDVTVSEEFVVGTVPIHRGPNAIFPIEPPQPGESSTPPMTDGVMVYIGQNIYFTGGELTEMFFLGDGTVSVDITTETHATTTRTRTTTDTYQTLTTIEVVGEADPNLIRSTTTLIDEVVTNTPRVVELQETRIITSAPGVEFDQTLPEAYNPADPDIIASIAAAKAAVNPANPDAVSILTTAFIQPGAVSPIHRTYDMKFRRLTTDDQRQVETSRTDAELETVTIVTVGPATVRVGPNGAESLFVPTGQTHVNTVTRIRRNIATSTTQTFTTTQFVLATTNITVGGAVTTFSISSRTRPRLIVTNESATNETAATRILGTFNGIRYDVVLNVPYSATDATIQAAINKAISTLQTAGASAGSRVVVGSPIRSRTATSNSESESTVFSEFVQSFESHSSPNGVIVPDPPIADDPNWTPGVISYVGPTIQFFGEDLSQLFVVAGGSTNIDIFSDRTATTTRTLRTTDTYQTLTTIEVVGEVAPVSPPPIVNDFHIIVPIPDQTSTGSAIGPVAVTVIDDDNFEGEVFTFEVFRSSAPDIIAIENIVIGGNGLNRTLTITPLPGRFGVVEITLRVPDGIQLVADETFQVTVSEPGTVPPPVSPPPVSPPPTLPPPASPPLTPPSHVFLRAVGADAGGPRVRVFRVDGSTAFDFLVYEPTFTGGVRVATADVNNDGTDDVLTAAGDGGGPRIVIFDGATGEVMRNFFAFDDTTRVGAFIAAADVNGDGFADYAVTAGNGGGPRVALFDGKTGDRIGNDFFAFDSGARTGFTIAMGALTNSGQASIIIGQLSGGSSTRVFDLLRNLQSELSVYEPSFLGGVNVAVGDFDSNGIRDLIVGAGRGGGPRVRGFQLLDGSLNEIGNGFSFDSATRIGVRVGSAVSGNQTMIVASFAGRVLSATRGAPISGDESPFGDDYLGGVWVS